MQRIARNEKIEESRELASDIQESLAKRLQRTNKSIRDRGVRKAPFVVLIGANMPSVLAEISFISNPADEVALAKPDGREHVAEGLYKGIEAYLQSTNSLAANQTKAPAQWKYPPHWRIPGTKDKISVSNVVRGYRAQNSICVFACRCGADSLPERFGANAYFLKSSVTGVQWSSLRERVDA